MNELENWTEITDGIFCYENYEIHVRYRDDATDILSAKADLYFVYVICSEEKHAMKRDKIYHGTVAGCLVSAVEYERKIE